jgi:hypothetical protein
MFKLVQVALGAVAWGVGSSAGGELFKGLKKRFKGEKAEKNLDERISEMEGELQKLKTQREEEKAKEASPEAKAE